MNCVDCGKEIKANEDREFVAVAEAEGNLYACGRCTKRIGEKRKEAINDIGP